MFVYENLRIIEPLFLFYNSPSQKNLLGFETPLQLQITKHDLYSKFLACAPLVEIVVTISNLISKEERVLRKRSECMIIGKAPQKP